MFRSSPSWHDDVDRVPVGVLAYRTRDGRPVACAVTPYVHEGDVVVTSTLAFPAKAVALQREGAAALLAAGRLLRGAVQVHVDREGTEFDHWVREQELRKYPPARALLSVPGHRRLFRWYVRRAYLRFVDPTVVDVADDDTTTLTGLDPDGIPTIEPLSMSSPPSEPFATDALAGPACVLTHHETEGFAELRQLRLDGTVADGWFRATRSVGSLEPQPTGPWADLVQLRRLARRARRAAHLVDASHPL